MSVARRVAIAQLVAEALVTERELAGRYAAFAARSTLEPLKAPLVELARAKEEHVATLESGARALGPLPGLEGVVPEPEATGGDGHGAEFRRVFRGERRLDVVYRELAGLLGDTPLLPLARLTAEAARDRSRLRGLYLKYS